MSCEYMVGRFLFVRWNKDDNRDRCVHMQNITQLYFPNYIRVSPLSC